MKAIRYLVTAAMLAALLAGTSACSSRESVTERDFGKSVHSMVERQTLNPTNATLPDPQAVDHGNGERLNAAMEAYKTDVTRPQGAN